MVGLLWQGELLAYILALLDHVVDAVYANCAIIAFPASLIQPL